MKQIFPILLFSISSVVLSQTTSENYIKSTTYQVETLEDEEVSDDDKIETVTYFDGAGRSKQIVTKQQGGDKEDLITPITYDLYGRQALEYLPYSRNSSSLNFEGNGLLDNLSDQYYLKYQEDFEASFSPNPNSELIYEKSPLNRIKEESTSGYAWRYDTDNVSLVDVQIPVPLNFETDISLDLLPLIPTAQTLGSGSISISNSNVSLSFDMIMQPSPLKVGQIMYLDTAPYLLDGILIGQLMEFGELIPYSAQIQNNYLVITSTDPDYIVEGLTFDINVSIDIPAQFETYQKEQSTNNTIRYESSTNSWGASHPVKHFGVEFIDDNGQTELVYIEDYPAYSLYKTIIKDENWQPNEDPDIVERNNITEEYTDKYGRIVLKRAFNNNEPHDTYYVYDKYGNLTYVIPPLASENILETGNQGFFIESQNAYPWTDLVNVDKTFAQSYNKRLSAYSNKDILNADLENEYGAQGGYTITTIEDSNLITLSISFSSTKALTLKQGILASLKEYGQFRNTELGRINGDGFEYIFIIENNNIVIKKKGRAKGELLGINEFFSSNTTLAYSQDHLWTDYVKVQPKFAFSFEKEVVNLAIETNQSILTTTLYNEFGGQGGLNISIDENDIVSVNILSSSSTPLTLKQGLVIPLKTKRRISDRELGSLSGEGYDYHFSIKENNLSINGYGSISNLSAFFMSPPPPETPIVDPETVGGLCYIYHYDYSNRVINKKIPGKGWQYIVYDKSDRPIMTQDANMRLNNEWLFAKYDIFSRPIYSGLFQYLPNGSAPNEQLELQEIVDSQSDPHWHETKVTTPQVISGTTLYYSNNSYPINNIDILTINYYDDYNFDSSGLALTFPSTILDQEVRNEAKTLLTGTKTRILDTNNWITAINYYDNKSRPIYYATYNEHLNTTDIIESGLNFIGNLVSKHSLHLKDSNEPILIIDNYIYDHSGRIKTTTQSISNSPFELISNNTYNEYGQLESKKIGGSVADIPENSLGLQTLDYSYNVKGWLRTINEGATNNADLFGFKINYNTIDLNESVPLYNGNISETHWQTANDFINRAYQYVYDALDRIKSAKFSNNYSGGITLIQEENFDLSNINYDKNGNILRLNRSGFITRTPNYTGIDHYGMIDWLSYDYEPRSNKLNSVVDVADIYTGFKDSSDLDDIDYQYDINGNLTKDTNMGIINITYNHFNLPKNIDVLQNWPTSEGTINYEYDANGIKMKKTLTQVEDEITTTIETKYATGFIYENDQLKMFPHPEGYVEIDENGIFSYAYNFKDHLGNVRLTYADTNGDGVVDPETEIISEKNYYPFGLQHKGYNNVISSNVNSTSERWNFQGQEQTQDLGLNIHEWKYRVSDPTTGRFWQIDPLTEDYVDWAPYVFSGNRVIDSWELEGLEPVRIALASQRTEGKDPTGEAFKAFFPKDALARDLIDHYVGNTQQEYELNRDELLEVYPIFNKGGQPINLSLTDYDFASVGVLGPGQSANFSDSVPVYAGTPGTLGNFSVIREGTITLNAETGKKEFNGSFIFKDIYNFNAADRPFSAELQVTIARNILPGAEFDIIGQLPVNQVQGGDITTTTLSGISFDPASIPKPEPTETRQEESN